MEIISVKIGLAIIFTFAAIGKLTGKTKSTFEKAGYSREVMYAIAIAEIILTVVLFTKYELLATLGLLAIIGGALLTLLRQRAKPGKYAMATISTILLSVLLYFFIGKYRTLLTIQDSTIETSNKRTTATKIGIQLSCYRPHIYCMKEAASRV